MCLCCRDRSYSCLDARLYDDETLTVVLQAQEENENKLRLLAQLPLGPALSCGEEFSWDPAFRYLPATLSALVFVFNKKKVLIFFSSTNLS